MSVVAAALRELIAAGLSGDALIAAVERIETALEVAPPTVSSARERKREADRQRMRDKRDNARQCATSRDIPPSFPEERKVSPCTPSKETQPYPSPSSSLRSDDSFLESAGASARADGQAPLFGEVLPPEGPSVSATARRMGFDASSFETWWFAYPHKVGKQDALKVFEVIAKSGRVSFDRLMNGLAAYQRTKPPDRAWCNPGTWLRQGRWDDEPASETGRTARIGGVQSRPTAGQSIAAGWAAALADDPDSDIGRAARAQGFASADDG